MQKIGLLSNQKREGSIKEGKKIAAWLQKANIEVLQPDEPYDVTDQEFLCG